VLAGFWQPAPSHTLLDTKTFKAGLAVHGRELVDGDLIVQLHVADDAKALDALAEELRIRSQQDRKQVFWAVGLNDAIDRETVQLFRSKEVLARKEREPAGEDTPALIAEERGRLRRHNDELRRLLRAACLTGRVSFRGNDRSPPDTAIEVNKAASEILGKVLPEVFERFQEGAAKTAEAKKGADALFTADNLQGLPTVFSSLSLLRDEKGKPVFRTDSGPLREVLQRANYGDTASGRYLADEFAKEPFGWDFEVVRMLVLCLIRAGKIDATSRGQTLDNMISSEARDLANSNVFRQASFRPRKGIEYVELVKAADAFRDTFGSDVKEITASAIAFELKKEFERKQDVIESSLGMLATHRLPGATMLELALGQIKAIQRGSDENAIGTFNAGHRAIKDAIKRAAELEQSLTEPRLHDLDRARQALSIAWPALQAEPDLPEDLKSRAEQLQDLLSRETFFRELPAIEQHARAIELDYARRFDDAQQARANTYKSALERLSKTSGWQDLEEEIRRDIAAPLVTGTQHLPRTVPLALLRSECEAGEPRLRQAIRKVREILDGERLATVQVQSYFGAGIDSEEQLDAALDGLRGECAKLIGAGKKVILQ